MSYALYHKISLLVTGTIPCSPQITPTTSNSASAPKSTASFDSLSINPSNVTDPVFGHSGDCSCNYKLITGVIVAALVVAITIILTLLLGFGRYVKVHKHEAPMTVLNEDYSTGIQDTKYTERDTGDYPGMPDDQAMESINIKQNEAYATNAEAKQCMAYAANINTERNSAYGTKFQAVVPYGEIDTYDYPAMND